MSDNTFPAPDFDAQKEYNRLREYDKRCYRTILIDALEDVYWSTDEINRLLERLGWDPIVTEFNATVTATITFTVEGVETDNFADVEDDQGLVYDLVCDHMGVSRLEGEEGELEGYTFEVLDVNQIEVEQPF